MLTGIQPTILLQIGYESMINSKVIFESIKGPDHICQGDLQAQIGWYL